MKLFAVALGCASLALGRLSAQEVDVTSVRFTNVRAPGGASGNWLEADIALNTKPAPGTPAQMVSRVRVLLTLGFELAPMAGNERHTDYYRADAECVALEPGRADVRFYLPWELVKRDQLHGDPKFWEITITAGGRPQTLSHAAASPSLVNADTRKNFESRATAAAGPNDGLLLPQFLTPFENEYPRATPSFVRRDAH